MDTVGKLIGCVVVSKGEGLEKEREEGKKGGEKGGGKKGTKEERKEGRMKSAKVPLLHYKHISFCIYGDYMKRYMFI